MKKKLKPVVKALVLLSGGLDSALALKIIRDQGVEVVAVNFTSPFSARDQGVCSLSVKVARELKVPCRVVVKGEDFFQVIRRPRFGYGKGVNPCIDCRIYMLKKAKKMMKELGARFIVTGEVLGQRPMSQHLDALNLVEKEAGVKGKLLRPLSARLLPPTEPEKKGWVDREALLAIKGRSRKEQFQMVKDYRLRNYGSPGGGCLLTERVFAARAKDLFKHRQRLRLADLCLLKTGRHFRLGENKIIVGRNEAENALLAAHKKKSDYIFIVPGWGSPTALLQGIKKREAVSLAAVLTATYSNCDRQTVLVKYGRQRPVRGITVNPITREEAGRYLVSGSADEAEKRKTVRVA